MSPTQAGEGGFDSRFPRVSGDEPKPNETERPNHEFSPRERG